MQDTEGKALPDSAFAFPTDGNLPSGLMGRTEDALRREALLVVWLDQGDRSAGYARRISSHGEKTRNEAFEIGLNRNHEPTMQFVTLAHELAHIHLGHCGADAKRNIKHYCPDHALREVEAETVAYLVAKRSGISPRSESYLDNYKGAFDRLNLHRIFTTANRIERLLGLPLEGNKNRDGA